MGEDKKVVERAIRDVQAGYPFPGIFEETVDTVKALVNLLQNLAPIGGRLLDIGCGALDKTVVFQRTGYQCFACDDFQDPWHRRSENLDPVLAFAKELGVEVYSQVEDHTIPWEEASFDVVTITNVIEHLNESPRELLNFAGRYLKPEGLLVVCMPNSVNLRKRLAVLRGSSNYTPVRGFYEYVGPWRGHVREFTFGETRQIVEWTGFDIVYKSTFHGLLNRRLANRLLRIVFKAMCVPFPGYRDSLLVAARKPAGWTPRQPDPNAMDQSLTDAWLGSEP